MKNARKTHDKMQTLNRASQSNGKGLDKAVLDSALDELIETFNDVNKKLDELLAKAKRMNRASRALRGAGAGPTSFAHGFFKVGHLVEHNNEFAIR